MGEMVTVGGHTPLFVGSSLTAVVEPFLGALNHSKASISPKQSAELPVQFRSHRPGLTTLTRRPGTP